MKKFFILSAIMLFSVLLSMGAGDQSHKLLKSIPRSAETVILADLSRIADQSGYSRVELISMLCSQVSPLMANIVSTMAEDGEIGVDLSGDIALFNTTDHEPLIAALELSDVAAVKRFLIFVLTPLLSQFIIRCLIICTIRAFFQSLRRHSFFLLLH